MLPPHLPTPDYDASLEAARMIVDCRDVRLATAPIRPLRLAPGAKPSPSAARGYAHSERVRTQASTLPSAKARPPLIGDDVDEPAAHIQSAAAAVHPEEVDTGDLPEDLVRAMRTISECIAGRVEIGAERRRALKVLRRVNKDLTKVGERLMAVCPRHILEAPQMLDFALMHALACAAVASPDLDLAPLFVVGFRLVGREPRRGLIRPGRAAARPLVQRSGDDAARKDADRHLRGRHEGRSARGPCTRSAEALQPALSRRPRWMPPTA